MVKLAIVEDNSADAQALEEFLARYSAEHRIPFEIRKFGDGMEFIENYHPDYDVVFLDIEMPRLNGMNSAKELRAIDSDVSLVFVTNMAQYAINGYEVSAVGFMVKPIRYIPFEVLMNKVLLNCTESNDPKLMIRREGDTVFLSPSRIYYVEALGHTLIFHTKNGDYTMNERLKNIAAKLSNTGYFLQIKSCYLINMKYVSRINSDSVIVNGDELSISRRVKKESLAAIANYLGGGGR